MPELQGKSCLVDLAEYDRAWRLLLLLCCVVVLSQDEVFDRRLLYPPPEVEGVGVESLVPAGLLVTVGDHSRRPFEVLQGFLGCNYYISLTK